MTISAEEIWKRKMEEQAIIVNHGVFTRILDLTRAGCSITEIAKTTGETEESVRSALNIMRNYMRFK